MIRVKRQSCNAPVVRAGGCPLMTYSCVVAERTAIAPIICAILCMLLSGIWAWDEVAVAWTGTEGAYNPSLVEYGDKFISALKHTSCLREHGRVIWYNRIFICAGPRAELHRLRCEPFNPWRAPFLECKLDRQTDVVGLGDVKLWVWPGRGVYAIFGRKPKVEPGRGPYCSSKVVYDQWISEIQSEPTARPWRLDQPVRLYLAPPWQYPDGPKHIIEKNWMPWVYRDGSGADMLYVTHMVNPHRILRIHSSGACEVAHETHGRPGLFNRFTGHSIHGGPPVIWVDGNLSRDGLPYYLGIMHYIEMVTVDPVAVLGSSSSSSLASPSNSSSSPPLKIKLYRHFAYKFQPQPPFAITDVSDELPLTFHRHPSRLQRAGTVYVSGLSMNANGTVYISYGSGDFEARVMAMSLRKLEDLFTGRIAFLSFSVMHSAA